GGGRGGHVDLPGRSAALPHEGGGRADGGGRTLDLGRGADRPHRPGAGGRPARPRGPARLVGGGHGAGGAGDALADVAGDAVGPVAAIDGARPGGRGRPGACVTGGRHAGGQDRPDAIHPRPSIGRSLPCWPGLAKARNRDHAQGNAAPRPGRTPPCPRVYTCAPSRTPRSGPDSPPRPGNAMPQDQDHAPRKLYIQTHGCQMNEYDSARMADVLAAAEGLELTSDAAEADVILVNTCSIREKAQEKVFSQLGRWKGLKQGDRPVLIGVGGCVASQEGEAIVKRAPFVDLVFGPQTLHRLPELVRERRATGRPQVDSSFPEIEKFDRLPEPRAEGPSAFVSIMEGCSKYCSFCVVPYIRGEEVSRPFEDVLVEVMQLAAQGVREVNLLGQNVNAYRGPMG